MGKHWHHSIGSDGIVNLVLDKANSKVNTLSQKVLEELELVLAELGTISPKGLVFKSGKSSGFILGAEVSEFSQVKTAAVATEAVRWGQALFRQITELPFPTVAAIDGLALGGGLELALACDYRVVTDSYSRTLGLPEVRLGIHPGLGGTVRTVHLVGPLKALDLMLTGRSLSPRQALTIGLIDRIVGREDLGRVAAEYIHGRPNCRRAPWYLRFLNLPVLRPWIARKLEAEVARRAYRTHYPAPYAIVDLWRCHGGHGDRAYAAEAASFGELLVSNSSRNLVRVFFLRERLRNLAPRERNVRQVHVVGAGVMGGDIAAWCATKGLTVTLQDRAQEFVEPALSRAEKLFKRSLRAPGEAKAAKQRLIVDLEGTQAGSADVVIEAVVEQLGVKQNVLSDLESRVKSNALIATNTSSIQLEDMATSLSHPERFVGLHFFNPVSKVPLVEVIRGTKSSEESLQAAMSFVIQIGKLPLPCRSAPGFLVNRILAPYMIEALRTRED
ncbi:MAG: 3-hydroxyacyl-CoA dehydrogenase NAD-binding domain-containing protein, partial [Gammaproteobacteria bacterium]